VLFHDRVGYINSSSYAFFIDEILALPGNAAKKQSGTKRQQKEKKGSVAKITFNQTCLPKKAENRD
jgi:hypothetical protein